MSAKYPYHLKMDEQLKYLCHYGVLAPSIHNIQPWLFSIHNSTLEIKINNNKLLRTADPTGRQTWISIGCCAQNILVAAANFGIYPAIVDIAKEGVSISFKSGREVENSAALNAIEKRVTNRSHYLKKSISNELVKKIESCWKSKDVYIKVVTDPEIIDFIATSTAKATQVALSMPEFKKELASVIRYKWSKKTDGIPSYALTKGMKSYYLPLKFKYINVAKNESQAEKNRMLAAGAIALVFSKGDTKKYWFESGRAYESLVLTATEFGLDNSTAAAIVEAPSFHEELESILEVKDRLQAVVRLGYAKKPAKHSPRATLTQLFS